MPHPPAETVDPSTEVARFWAEIRSVSHETRAETTRQVLLASCPSVDAFSFDVVDEEEAGGEILRESPVASVSAGTPRPVVESWNQNKLVGVQLLWRERWICGAAVGNDVTALVSDFKACAFPGNPPDEGGCATGTHLGPRVKRMSSPEGLFVLAIMVPTSSTAVRQVFSRPVLSEADLRYLATDSSPFARLLSYRMEPRVWKVLFELFPGAETLKIKAMGSPLPTPSDTRRRSTPYEQDLRGGEVTDDPISSPAMGGRTGAASYQPDLRVDSGRNSLSGTQGLFGDESVASESVFPWDDADGESHLSSNHGDGSGSQGGDPRPGAGYLGTLVTALMDRVTELEASMNSTQELSRKKDQSLAKKFASLSAENSQLRLSLQKAREEMQRGGRRHANPGMDSVDVFAVVEQVEAKLDLGQYATKSELAALSQDGTPTADLVRRIEACEAEVLAPSGIVVSLKDRVDLLEAAKVATAIEMGGYIFADEAACDAWARAHNDPALHRFVPDFLSLFLLAEPKYESIQGGLQQMAAVVKANYTTRDVATIELSYSLTYPPQILKKSDKVEANLTDGIVWAAPFASLEAFEGDFNNGTLRRMKKALDAAAKAIEDGVDYQFPVTLRPKTNGVFKEQCRSALRQCMEFLDALAPLQRNIAGGGMSTKESWERVSVFARQVFLDVASVRAPHSEASVGSMIWSSFRTTQLLKDYQRHGWVEHPKTSSILALTSMRKEGRAVEELTSKVNSQTTTLNRHGNEIKRIVDDLKELKKKNPSLA